ncbi:MAG: hypothetical protein A4E26_00128 [Methanobacterium sp. PtaU1.Bin097]|nr:MAG: hypothetical protein A4E26_00128 [Methanobacterium sp. PtaU1.Bin097]
MSVSVIRPKLEVYEGRVVAVSSISHMGESSGTEQLFNRKNITYKGKNVRVPCINANSIRGILRRKARDVFLEIIEKRFDDYGAYVQYFLNTGGQQVKSKVAKDKGAQGDIVDYKYEQNVRRIIPYFSLFGGVAEQHFNSGRFSVSDLIPYACQTQFMTGVESNLNVNSVITEQRNTTMDDSHVEGEKGFGEGDDKQKRQMRYGREEMKAGTLMRYKFKLYPDATDMDKACFHSTIRYFLVDPIVGGNQRIGCGELNFLDLKVDDELADKYEAYVLGVKDKAIAYLDDLDRRWG